MGVVGRESWLRMGFSPLWLVEAWPMADEGEDVLMELDDPRDKMG